MDIFITRPIQSILKLVKKIKKIFHSLGTKDRIEAERKNLYLIRNMQERRGEKISTSI